MIDDHSGRQGVLLALVGQMDGMLRKIDHEGANPDILIPVIDNWKHNLATLLDDKNLKERTKRAYRLNV